MAGQKDEREVRNRRRVQTETSRIQKTSRNRQKAARTTTQTERPADGDQKKDRNATEAKDRMDRSRRGPEETQKYHGEARRLLKQTETEEEEKKTSQEPGDGRSSGETL